MVKARLPILEGASYQRWPALRTLLNNRRCSRKSVGWRNIPDTGTETILFWLFLGKFSKKYTESFPTFIKKYHIVNIPDENYHLSSQWAIYMLMPCWAVPTQSCPRWSQGGLCLFATAFHELSEGMPPKVPFPLWVLQRNPVTPRNLGDQFVRVVGYFPSLSMDLRGLWCEGFEPSVLGNRTAVTFTSGLGFLQWTMPSGLEPQHLILSASVEQCRWTGWPLRSLPFLNLCDPKSNSCSRNKWCQRTNDSRGESEGAPSHHTTHFMKPWERNQTRAD